MVMANLPAFDRITVETGKCGGKPCIRGMRITVRRVLELLAECDNRTELLKEYPYLEEEDLNSNKHSSTLRQQSTKVCTAETLWHEKDPARSGTLAFGGGVAQKPGMGFNACL